MGNSGSSSLQPQAPSAEPTHSWAHSYPRPSHKVLPERVPGQRLRLTRNGNILHNGGTLTGRKQMQYADDSQIRTRSSSHGGQVEPTRVLFGSEPDLRFTGRDYQQYSNDSPSKLRISRSKKKYKAPVAPHNNNGMESSSPDSYQHWEMTGEVIPPVRRLRLFKTKAESNKKRNVEESMSPPTRLQKHHIPNPGPLHRSLSSPQFQAELLEAAERLRPVREPPVGKAAESPIPRNKNFDRNRPSSMTVLQSRENFSSNNHISQNERVIEKNNYNNYNQSNGYRSNQNHHDKIISNVQRSVNKDEIAAKIKNRNNRANVEQRARGEGSTGRDSTPETKQPRAFQEKRTENSWEIIPKSKPPPVKTFYFGMSEESNKETDNIQEVDRFAESLHRRAQKSVAKSKNKSLNVTTSESEISSDAGNDENTNGISLQLRPMLPRKQLDIPRFSPSTAWRLLSTLESPPPSEEDDLIPLEDRIPAPPLPLHLHPDKSADSGISGDASPQHQDSTHNSQAAWTPQQDLEETSSDGGLDSAPVSPESLPAVKFSPRFSLSLPRDDRLAIYSQPDKERNDGMQFDSFHSLKKLKRSMSGALGRNSSPKESTSLPLDGNWVLSRSVPNSLNNGNTSLQRWSSSSPSSPDQEDDVLMTSLVKQPSFSYLQNGGHVMYLPEYSSPVQQREKTIGPLAMSKSCEDLSQPEQRLPQSITQALETPRTRSGKKFTFQSTVRQIERRRLAEKLSKEAEQKERQRLGELEAMRRVEEEFQRKREREKADIRQQLRLFSLTQGTRAQPDGAEPPPPATEVLSEFRQPRRDYRDFKPHRIHQDLESSPIAERNTKHSTVHPEVVYQMPKSTQVYVNPHIHSNGSGVGSMSGTGDCGGISTPRSSSSDNYRRNFAQGALPHSLVSSDSELSQPNTRPTSRNQRRSRF
uniref:Uncharacterized protein n=1 Tax=Clastoptera arizonana TaxID=38151 RepID=A0A1B6BXV3_9HEMI